MFERVKEFVIRYNVQITIVTVLVPLIIQFKIFIYPMIVGAFEKIPTFEKVYDYAAGFRNPFKSKELNHSKMFIDSLTHSYKDDYPSFAISNLKSAIVTLISLEKQSKDTKEKIKISKALGQIEQRDVTPAVDILLEHIHHGKSNKIRAQISKTIASLIYFDDVDQAIEMYKQALEYDPTSLSCYNALGNIYAFLGQHEEAAFYYNNLASIAASDKDWNNVAKAKANLGANYHKNGDLGLAIKMYSEAISINEQIGNQVESARQYYNLGQVAEIKGDLDVACLNYRKSRVIFHQYYQDNMVKLLDKKIAQFKCHNR